MHISAQCMAWSSKFTLHRQSEAEAKKTDALNNIMPKRLKVRLKQSKDIKHV